MTNSNDLLPYSERIKSRAMSLLTFPLLLLVSMIYVYIFVGLKKSDNLSILDSHFLMLAVNLTVVIIVFSLFRSQGIRNFFKFQNASLKNIFIGVLTGIWLYFGLQIFSGLINIIFGSDDKHIITSSDTSDRISDGLQTSSIIAIIVVLFVVVLAPVFEELIYRATIFGLFERSRINRDKFPFIAMIVSGFIFGLAHFQGATTATDWFVVIWTSISGMIFCTLLYKTKSIYTSMAAHITYNSITIILSLMAL